MGWTNQVVQASEVIIAGAPDSLLVYDGTPGPGTLIASITSAGGTDQYGNNLLPGIASYLSPTAAFLDGGQLNLGNGAAGAVLLINDSGVLEVEGTAGETSFAVTVPIAAALVASEPGSFPTAETWHAVTFANGWAGSGAGTNGLFYRATVDGKVHVIGDVSSPGTATAINVAIPSGYWPAVGINMEFSRYDDAGTAHATMGTNGVITMQTTVGAGKGMFVNTIYPLQAP